MKKILLPLLVATAFNATAQDELHCGTDQVMKKIYDANPALKAEKHARDLAFKQQPKQVTNFGTYTIPVVFHILHMGGPENISDSQVIDAVRVLNRDYAKQNPDTVDIIPSFKSIADSTGIQFALATKDPNGNCTNGIVHYYDPDTDWNDASPTIYSHTWDPTKYMNVYIVRTITLGSGFGAAGYTYFPGTWSPGDPQDAIVVLNNYFGTIGTGSNFLSRVLTHEAGHWFDLYHVFGSNGAGVDCTSDDFVNDTPPTIGYTYCPDPANPWEYQTCQTGVDENYQNYMDYSYCCRMFTHDQRTRMNAALQNNIAGRDNLWSAANLIATGVLNPASPCVPVADFNYDRTTTCVGTPVTFSDNSANSAPTAFNWSFPGGTPSASTSASPVVTYTTPGVYSVSYTCATSAGTATPITKTNIITVTNNTAAYSGGWTESFETSPLPNSDWTLSNTSGGTNWTQSSDAAYTGTYSAELGSINNTRKTFTSMTGPSVNLSTIPAPALHFKLATAEYDPSHVNTLRVYISTDCQETWTNIYTKTGGLLVTSNSSTVPFIPSGPSDWRMETINLAAYASATSASIKFEYNRDTLPGAVNTFIDDINIQSTTGIEDAVIPSGISLFPNPAEGNATLSFVLDKTQTVSVFLTDILGRKISTITEKEISAGPHRFIIGDNNRPEAGIYFLHIETGGKTFTQKLILK